MRRMPETSEPRSARAWEGVKVVSARADVEAIDVMDASTIPSRTLAPTTVVSVRRVAVLPRRRAITPAALEAH